MRNVEKVIQKVCGFGSKEFIEKAIDGGWKAPKGFIFHHTQGLVIQAHEGFVPVAIETILLDPLAWKAVGKTEGWSITTYKRREKKIDGKWFELADDTYLYNMLEMIRVLDEDK